MPVLEAPGGRFIDALQCVKTESVGGQFFDRPCRQPSKTAERSICRSKSVRVRNEFQPIFHICYKDFELCSALTAQRYPLMVSIVLKIRSTPMFMNVVTSSPDSVADVSAVSVAELSVADSL
ncbi:hypothetical protein C0J52_18262 [Blattella germanica]|nr:hypothetical protein C0J52_18262 [Blattella germanica]